MNEENKTLASIKNLKDLEKYADFAYNFLHGDRGEEQEKNEYSNDKKIIQALFAKEEYTFSDIKLQLIVIDSVYSTNTSKNNDAIKEITEKLFKIFDESKHKIKKEVIVKSLEDLIKKKENKIIDWFSSSFGYQKAKIDSKKQAISLLSKYAYFITEYKFPIYDSFVREVYQILITDKLVTKIALDATNKSFVFSNFVDAMTDLSEKAEIDSFEKLDNLMWIIGKIRGGGFPLLLGKSKYEKLLKDIFISEYTIPNSIFKSSSFTKTKITNIVIEELSGLGLNNDFEGLIQFSSFDNEKDNAMKEAGDSVKIEVVNKEIMEKGLIDSIITELIPISTKGSISKNKKNDTRKVLFDIVYNDKKKDYPKYVYYSFNDKKHTLMKNEKTEWKTK